eukprot:TRINITY_DN9340_c0_g1_i2.p1 TRINITY_DN9340_c0_g1~~TRINITY_DN9340_c0_g1_i2.p1  ORF type:complete len:132 (-),score=8.62 TRINITY_DN9340_c0_g1_i2:6-401(-)
MRHLHKEITNNIPIVKNGQDNSDSNLEKTKKGTPPKSSMLDTLFRSQTRTNSQCLTCHHRNTIEAYTYEYSLSYQKGKSFASMLRNSLRSHVKTHAWCEECKCFQISEMKKQAVTLPNICLLYTSPSPRDS